MQREETFESTGASKFRERLGRGLNAGTLRASAYFSGVGPETAQVVLAGAIRLCGRNLRDPDPDRRVRRIWESFGQGGLGPAHPRVTGVFWHFLLEVRQQFVRRGVCSVPPRHTGPDRAHRPMYLLCRMAYLPCSCLSTSLLSYQLTPMTMSSTRFIETVRVIVSIMLPDKHGLGSELLPSCRPASCGFPQPLDSKQVMHEDDRLCR